MSPPDPPAAADEGPSGAPSGAGRAVWLLLAPLLTAAAIVGVLWRLGGSGRQPQLFTHQPAGVMSTECEIQAVFRAEQRGAALGALRAAEQALRDVEARMSVYLERSELGNFNAAPAGQKVPLSPPTMEVLRASAGLYEQSRGAFDVTVFPLVRLWKQAGKDDALPTAEQIAAARAESRWDQIELREDGAVKRTATACVDLGGIAKGYAVDCAVEALKAAGASGGAVNLGGNLRVFGRKADGNAWTIDVRDPFAPQEDKIIATITVSDSAACTSAHYFRHVTIAGRQYSHILDPATGRPTSATASVTVLAPTCMEADGWATALSVLGPEGVPLLPAGLEAMLIVGGPPAHKVYATEGFQKLMRRASEAR